MTANTATFAQTPQACTDARPRTVALVAPSAGMLWFGGWLFAIGFAHLSFWKAVLGLVIWPYFLGVLAR